MQYRGFAGIERRDAKSEVVSVGQLQAVLTGMSTPQGKRRKLLTVNLEHTGLKQRAAQPLRQPSLGRRDGLLSKPLWLDRCELTNKREYRDICRAW